MQYFTRQDLPRFPMPRPVESIDATCGPRTPVDNSARRKSYPTLGDYACKYSCRDTRPSSEVENVDPHRYDFMEDANFKKGLAAIRNKRTLSKFIMFCPRFHIARTSIEDALWVEPGVNYLKQKMIGKCVYSAELEEQARVAVADGFIKASRKTVKRQKTLPQAMEDREDSVRMEATQSASQDVSTAQTPSFWTDVFNADPVFTDEAASKMAQPGLQQDRQLEEDLQPLEDDHELLAAAVVEATSTADEDEVPQICLDWIAEFPEITRWEVVALDRVGIDWSP